VLRQHARDARGVRTRELRHRGTPPLGASLAVSLPALTGEGTPLLGELIADLDALAPANLRFAPSAPPHNHDRFDWPLTPPVEPSSPASHRHASVVGFSERVAFVRARAFVSFERPCKFGGGFGWSPSGAKGEDDGIMILPLDAARVLVWLAEGREHSPSIQESSSLDECPGLGACDRVRRSPVRGIAPR
jgi:hypothetical protein